ncbi:PTS sugar transporter subunit IIA [Demequina sp.]|uniref:PTS sugar transporter subunit IIA n=1 Tax=Demequina sp. TaxID=2050685 RepID=UPI003A84DDC8
MLSPVTGTAIPMSEVPDPVFSASLVGPGVAIDPDRDARAEVRSPIDGTVVKLHAHAFVVQAPDTRAVLVHLGINTVQLDGEGFSLAVEEGDQVTAGQVLLTWDIHAVAATGRSVVCPVVALDAAADSLVIADGNSIGAAPLFTWN